ncbi:TetR-like C-terminal domain-containing protein [Bradyrhizobium sp. dw_78]|uniref:TetR-like C-terminal domain-containing protein n=1 Tax=Bradyrhizobium sp. dw_78 TaxID=2719793 RepID=UPI001BD5413E|nr:TetR-like C-terminal domain-containing protein [Bradyrhizobium sp. dw_78]
MERKRSDDNYLPRQPSGAAVMRVEVTDALSRAFFSEWSRVGYAALSLERVAKAAGVGKAALYRRWPSKAAMASDLLSRVGLTLTETGDMGSLEADVRALLLAFRRVLRHRLIRRILTDLLAEIGREPALETALRPFQQARRDRVQQLIERAIARGELAATVDRETILDFLVAPLYWRLAVTKGRSDIAYIERLVRMTKAAMAAG